MIVSVREDEGLLTYFYLCSVNLQFEKHLVLKSDIKPREKNANVQQQWRNMIIYGKPAVKL